MLTRGIVLLLTVTVCSWWGTVSPAHADDGAIHVMSWNINNASDGSNGEIAWDQRKDEVVDVIVRTDAGIVGLQEARQSSEYQQPKYVINQVLAAQPDYSAITPPGYSHDATTFKTWTAIPKIIFYRHTRFTKVASGGDELPNPYVQGDPDNNGCWEKSADRSLTWAVLQDDRSPIGTTGNYRRYIVVNTHLPPDRVCWKGRNRQAEFVQDRIEQLRATHGQHPIIVMGDFNTDDHAADPVVEDNSIATMEEERTPHDAAGNALTAYELRRAASYSGTTTASQGTHQKGWPSAQATVGNRIDYIFLSKLIKANGVQTGIDRCKFDFPNDANPGDCNGRATPSDHFAITTAFSYPS